MIDIDLPFISVIVPFRNAKATLTECINALALQEYPKEKYELIFIDNNSNNESASIFQKYKGIILLKETKIGSYSARNKGISAAKGGILAFTDSDCVPDKKWLKYLGLTYLNDKNKNCDNSSKIDAVAGELISFEARTTVQKYYEKHLVQKNFLADDPPYAATANFSVRKSIALELGCFDASFKSCGDADFSWRLQAKGYKITYRPEAVVFHKHISTTREFIRKIFFQSSYAPKVLKNNLAFVEKNAKLRRICSWHYRELMKNLFLIVSFQKHGYDRNMLKLDTIFIAIRKLGLLYGSLKYLFFYI
jgi:GT2 family glycosyltransferase